jgi:integrase/recombinase XerD
MTYLATATGIRNSDVRSLELSDINHDEELIEISDSKFGDSYKAAMTSELSLQLKQWKNHGRQGLTIEESNEYVFPSKHGGKLETNQSFNTKVKAAAERAEIQDVIGRCRVTGGQQYMNSKYRKVHRVTVHTLRHTFVTMLKKLKVPGDIRALAANHDNLRSLQRYEHYYEEEYDLIRSVLSSDRIPRL